VSGPGRNSDVGVAGAARAEQPGAGDELRRDVEHALLGGGEELSGAAAEAGTQRPHTGRLGHGRLSQAVANASSCCPTSAVTGRQILGQLDTRVESRATAAGEFLADRRRP
jgi:hypothetical protein